MIRKLQISAMALILSTGLIGLSQSTSAREGFSSQYTGSKQNVVTTKSSKSDFSTNRLYAHATPQRGNTYRPGSSDNSNNTPTTRPATPPPSENKPSYRPSAPSNSGSPSGNTYRPGTGNSNIGNSGSKPETKPSTPGYRPEKPGSSNKPESKPSIPGFRPERPGSSNRPHHSGGYYPPTRPNYRPSSPAYRPYHHGHYLKPPVRPYRPAYRPIPRPVYPPYYRPYYKAPILKGILGLTFGITLNASLDYLYNNGYSIDGYEQNTVYLRDVKEMSYRWTDAILNYNSNGSLYGAQFIYSTSHNDNKRYRKLYNKLTSNYGNPISNGSNSYSWYGREGNGYVTLQYYYQYVNGYPRYYTTLTYSY